MICAWIETSSAETGSSATMKSGFEREGAGDADALALAAGELVRVARRGVGGQARRSRSSSRTRCAAARRPAMPCDAQRLADDRARRCAAGSATRTGPGRPSASAAAAGAGRRSPSVRDVLAVELDRAGGRLVEPEDRAADGGLPAARLADQAERLAAPDVESHAVDGAGRRRRGGRGEAALDREPDLAGPRADEQVAPSDWHAGPLARRDAARRSPDASALAAAVRRATGLVASRLRAHRSCSSPLDGSTRRPVAGSTSRAAVPPRDCSTSYRQRGWNGQPAGGSSMSRGGPRSAAARLAAAASRRGTL